MTAQTSAPGALPNSTEATPQIKKYSYSHKRLNAFDLWQAHVRKSAEAMGQALFDVSESASKV